MEQLGLGHQLPVLTFRLLETLFVVRRRCVRAVATPDGRWRERERGGGGGLQRFSLDAWPEDMILLIRDLALLCFLVITTGESWKCNVSRCHS